MAIVRPSEQAVAALELEQPIMVDSDADSNAKAILEIETWCREHQLVRVRENWLRTVREGGQTFRRGVGFRPRGDIGEQYQELIDIIEARVADMPETSNSVELKRG
jgi:hypothetical protein